MPIAALNRSEALWGPDATTFDPTRWLEKNRGEFHKRREEIPGYPHLLTFGYGPRVCIGKTFALAEIKVCSLRQRVC
jgi:cytochrome P450